MASRPQAPRPEMQTVAMRFPSRRRLVFALLISVPLALFFFAWRAASWRPVTRRVGPWRIFTLHFSPDGRTLFCGDELGEGRTLSVSSLEQINPELTTLRGSPMPLTNPIFSPTGNLLFGIKPAGPNQIQLQVIQANSGRLVWSRSMNRSHSYEVLALMSPTDEQLLLSPLSWSKYGEVVEVVNLRSGKSHPLAKAEIYSTWRGLFSPDGSHLMLCGHSGVWKCYDSHTFQLIWTKSPAKTPSAFYPVSLAYSQDTKVAILCYDNGRVDVRDAKTGQLINIVSSGYAYPTRAIISNDKRSIFIADGLGQVEVFDARSGNFIKLLSPRTGAVLVLTLSPDGSHLAIGRANGEVEVWRVQ